MQIDDAVAETLKRDIAAILSNLRANAGFDQFLDGGNGLGILRIEVVARLRI